MSTLFLILRIYKISTIVIETFDYLNASPVHALSFWREVEKSERNTRKEIINNQIYIFTDMISIWTEYR